MQNLAHEVRRLVRGVGQNLRVGRIEPYVGNHAKEAALFALDDHESAGTNVLDGVPLVQLHFQTVDEGTIDDHANTPPAFLHIVHFSALESGGQSWILRRMEESNS